MIRSLDLISFKTIGPQPASTIGEGDWADWH